MRLLVSAGMAAGLALVAAAPAAADSTVWLCRPGIDPNPCGGPLTTTVKAFGKPSRVKDPAANSRGFACFYVYPTVSEQTTPIANLNIDPAQISIAKYQAARFSQICDVYAPMYRQVTLAGLGTATLEDREIAYSDVLAAWREFRAANPDRPVTLIGHSQGSGVLKRLLREQIEPDPQQRSLLVSALLTGSAVAVPKGKAVGGDFTTLRLCTRAKQTSCIVSYATFAVKPPKDSLFGVSRTPKTVAACTNPVSLANKKYRPASSLVRGEPMTGLLGGAQSLMYSGKIPKAKTPWLRPKDRYRVKCVFSGGAHVLMAKPIGKSRALKASPTPAWGLHLADVNLVLGDLIDLVRTQQQAHRG